ncbi:uncharacterized protein LOC117304460 [Asterias rubens]|uniref:uncharacterized protein LOC117304460 n=1 Tax=Asterias rubens TaxID=7604 RepID=UPI001454E500|nr:uncharacterized protein LOC117304460 [Asterias rubens]
MSEPVRVVLWGCPRTCSSSFLKCMSKIPDTQVLFELFTTAHLYGPERDQTVATTFQKEPHVDTKVEENGLLARESKSGFHSSVATYSFAKKQLEADYQGKKVIIAKEMAQCLIPKLDHLPKGYQHVFLIRNPVKVFPSWKKIIQEVLMVRYGELTALDDLIIDRQARDVMPSGFGFKETYELYQYIKDNKLGPEPIIIDTEDLKNNPAGILSQFCERVGLPYTDDLLAWEKGSDVADSWIISQRHKFILKNAKTCEVFRESTEFNKSPMGNENGVATLTADVQRCVDASIPYYTKMFEHRLKV